MKRGKINKKSKQQIVIERYEILQKAKKLKVKEIKYKDMKEILGVKERTLRNWKILHKRLAIRGLYQRSKKPNKIIVEKRIFTDSMLRIIEQTRKENLYYGKRKLQEMLLRQGYDLKLTTIRSGLKNIMEFFTYQK